MSEFTLYSYQCCPIRPDIPNNNNEEIFPDELEKADRKAMDNMNVHQELIDKILTADLYRHFENRKELAVLAICGNNFETIDII